MYLRWHTPCLKLMPKPPQLTAINSTFPNNRNITKIELPTSAVDKTSPEFLGISGNFRERI